MKNFTKIFSVKSLTLAVAAFTVVGLPTAQALPITITAGNAGGNGSTDNVLFNDGTLSHSGTLVQGNFAGSGSGFIIDFTSSSGNNLIEGSGGQATITGQDGNDPFTSLTFGLEGGATFLNAILNPDASSNGHITFTVNYINFLGSPDVQQFNLSGNGQNFFHVDATGGARITQITISTDDTTFADASQFRIGGFERPDTTNVPDSGTTLALIGMAVTGLGLLRRKLS